MTRIIQDVTHLVDFELNDDELLPLTRCVCGATFQAWTFTLGVYDDDPNECDYCGRKLYFRPEIHVYEVQDGSSRV